MSKKFLLLIIVVVIIVSLSIGYIVYVNSLITKLSQAPMSMSNLGTIATIAENMDLVNRLKKINSKYVNLKLKSEFYKTKSLLVLGAIGTLDSPKVMWDIMIEENLLFDTELEREARCTLIEFFTGHEVRFRPMLEQMMVDEEEDMVLRVGACISLSLKAIGNEDTVKIMLGQIEKYYLCDDGDYGAYTSHLLQSIERLYNKYRSDSLKTQIVSTLTKCRDDVNVPAWQKKRIEDLLAKISSG